LACGDVRATNNRGRYDSHKGRNGHGRYDNRHDGRYDGRYDRSDRYRRSGVTLYTGARFTGRSIFIGGDYANLGSTGFNDVASSVRIDGGGLWRLCSDKNYGGRCVTVSSGVVDLRRIGLGDNISSVRRIR
jgi:hypothetical protein